MKCPYDPDVICFETWREAIGCSDCPICRESE